MMVAIDDASIAKTRVDLDLGIIIMLFNKD